MCANVTGAESDMSDTDQQPTEVPRPANRCSLHELMMLLLIDQKTHKTFAIV